MISRNLADYEAMIPQVAELLVDEPALQAFFLGLTPGYQREWARYLFGVKADATQTKHLAEMKQIFAAGYKSKRGYTTAMKQQRTAQ